MPDDDVKFMQETSASYLSGADTDIPVEASDAWKAVRSAQVELYSVGDKGAAETAGHYSDDTLPRETRDARARETAEKATAAHREALAKSQASLVVLEQKLTALALPKAPTHAADLANARDEIRTRLDGLEDQEALREVMTIAGSAERDLSGVLVSSWGAALLRRHGIDVASVKAQAIRAAAEHGDQTARRAAKALGDALLKAKKAHGAAAVAGLTGIENANEAIGKAAIDAGKERQRIVSEAARVNRVRAAER